MKLDFLFAGLLALSCLFTASKAHSGDPNVACVQEQLHFLGHDPGAVDGQSGPRTRDAVKAMRASVSDPEKAAIFDALPAFSQRASVGWCREIAEVFPEAVQFLPSRADADLHIADDVADAVRDEFLGAYRQSLDFLAQEYGVQLASRPVLVVGRDPDEIKWLLKGAQDLEATTTKERGQTASRTCRKGTGVGGSARRHNITLCYNVPGLEATLEKRGYHLHIRRTMMHEMVHHMQRELTYDKVPRWVRKGTKPRRRMGPPWMVEGSADVLAARYLKKHASLAIESVFRLYARASVDTKMLGDIRKDGEVRSPEAYRSSHFAVAVLAQRFGEESLIRFWRRAGETDNWFTAFREVYGMRVEDYEAMFVRFMNNQAEVVEFLHDIDFNKDGLIAGRNDLLPKVRG